MWQRQTFDRKTINAELALAGETGLNSIRVFLPYIVWEQDAGAFISVFDEFLGIAATHGLSVLPVLFDDCSFSGKEPYLGEQDAPVPGVHNSGWTASPGFARADDPSYRPKLRGYVQDLVRTFQKDGRVLAWDIYNEPGNSGRGSRSLPLLEAAFAWGREINPIQPFTTGAWNWEGPMDAVNQAALELSDIVSFHSYGDLPMITEQAESLRRYDRPILCTEWLNRKYGKVETHLPFFRQEGIGAYHWGFVTGKTQTNLHWSTMSGAPDANPDIWQHDLYHADHSPYCAKEIALFKER